MMKAETVGRYLTKLQAHAVGKREMSDVSIRPQWLSWVSERLGMGDESRVTQAIRRVTKRVEPRLESLKAELERIYERNALAEV